MAGEGPEPYAALGEYLTAHEAQRLAVALCAGATLTQALGEVNPVRRGEARRLLAAAGLGPGDLGATLAVLGAIAGARSVRSVLTPVWTMPGTHPAAGRLTSQVLRLIDGARMSVVCSSYNFTPRSRMWTALRAASQRPQLSVTVYLDAAKGTPRDVAAHLPGATVYRTLTPPGQGAALVNHAKFVVIDRQLVLLTSANFSGPAENTNIELGLLVQDTALAESIETVMRAHHGVLYELVPPTPHPGPG